MIDIIKAKLTVDTHLSYKDDENFKELPEFLTEETEKLLQWIKENTSEEAKRIIIARENEDIELFKQLADPMKSLEEKNKPDELLVQIIIENAINPELFLMLLITRSDVKQFILSLVGDIKSVKVVPIAVMLIELLKSYEKTSEMIKDF